MIKIRVYIINSYGYLCDDDVYVDIFLPAVPNIGDLCYLGIEPTKTIEVKAKASKEIAMCFVDYLYPREKYQNINKISDSDINSLSFNQANMVHKVFYVSNKDYACIALGTEKSTEN